jgi:hypothetical protein
MECDCYGQQISVREEMDHFGQTLCEECYMQGLSPTREWLFIPPSPYWVWPLLGYYSRFT